jgi:dUTP pyrophosphatase
MLKFCKVRDVKSPARANATDAGIDFFVPNDFPETTLAHGESILIPAGVKVDVPKGWALIFQNKSGVASKRKLDVGACVVDHGYEGEVHLNLHNVGKDPQTIKPGEKIVQGVMFEIGGHQMVETPESEMWLDSESDRGAGGFGSTGTV